MMKTVIRIGGVPEHFNLPWRLLEEDQEFQNAHNFELLWNDIHGGTGDMVKHLREETLDVCVLLTEGITKAISEGLDAEIVNNYVKSSLKWGIHVPFNSNYKNEGDLDPSEHVFAISRYGSGSHLMAYIMAENNGWDSDDLQFSVVGSLQGGLEALEKSEAHIFLWEKFTTHPYTLQNKCRYIGEVPTPWPCFSIAATQDFLSDQRVILNTVLEKVMEYARQIKTDVHSPEFIAKRYDLNPDQVKLWLKETEWNYDLNRDDEMLKNVKEKLTELGLISA